jgi:Putative restriction endonuclease
MAEPARAMTADEFMAWDDGTDTRYELVGGMVVAMTPPTYAHGIIVGNAYAAVRVALEARAPCQAAVEAGIRLDQANQYKADVAASCADPVGALYVPDPFLIVEVLSESTWRDDIGSKLRSYRTSLSAGDLARRQPRALGAGVEADSGSLDCDVASAWLGQLRERGLGRTHRARRSLPQRWPLSLSSTSPVPPPPRWPRVRPARTP